MIRQEDLGRFKGYENRAPQPVARRPASPAMPRRPFPMEFIPPQPAAAPETPAASLPSAPVDLNEILEETLAVPGESQPQKSRRAPRLKLPAFRWRPVAVTAAGLAVLAGGGLVFSRLNTGGNPVPASLKTAVDYPVYYPDAAKLPQGYKVDAGSFTNPTHNVIVYSLSNSQGQKLNVSLQDKPSASDLKAFSDYRIPLHTTVSTPIGQAVVGAIGSQSVASLPTGSNAWLIVTAPHAVGQNALDQVLRSFKY